MPPIVATRQSWTSLQPLPANRSPLFLQREFTEQEWGQIRLGFIPESMEDRWFLFTEGDTLYVHRSWTGNCIYQLRLLREDTRYVIRDAFVNRDEGQYAAKDDRADETLLLFLIDHLLLDKDSAVPIAINLPLGITEELHHQHVLGRGRRAEAGAINVTIVGTLRWLGRWLLWLMGR